MQYFIVLSRTALCGTYLHYLFDHACHVSKRACNLHKVPTRSKVVFFAPCTSRVDAESEGGAHACNILLYCIASVLLWLTTRAAQVSKMSASGPRSVLGQGLLRRSPPNLHIPGPDSRYIKRYICPQRCPIRTGLMFFVLCHFPVTGYVGHF